MRSGSATSGRAARTREPELGTSTHPRRTAQPRAPHCSRHEPPHPRLTPTGPAPRAMNTSRRTFRAHKADGLLAADFLPRRHHDPAPLVRSVRGPRRDASGAQPRRRPRTPPESGSPSSPAVGSTTGSATHQPCRAHDQTVSGRSGNGSMSAQRQDYGDLRLSPAGQRVP